MVSNSYQYVSSVFVFGGIGNADAWKNKPENQVHILTLYSLAPQPRNDVVYSQSEHFLHNELHIRLCTILKFSTCFRIGFIKTFYPFAFFFLFFLSSLLTLELFASCLPKSMKNDHCFLMTATPFLTVSLFRCVCIYLCVRARPLDPPKPVFAWPFTTDTITTFKVFFFFLYLPEE